MSFYDKLENVEAYIKMCEGYEPLEPITIMKKHLKKGSTLLELGMGPGYDLNVLRKDYIVTGSDIIEHFINLYKEEHGKSDLMILDAVTLDTDRKFDCIFSNKVLMHLTKEELETSILNQKHILNANGLICHTFWKGTELEYMDDTLTQYYQEDELMELFNKHFKTVYIKTYKEFEDDDSILLVMKVR